MRIQLYAHIQYIHIHTYIYIQTHTHIYIYAHTTHTHTERETIHICTQTHNTGEKCCLHIRTPVTRREERAFMTFAIRCKINRSKTHIQTECYPHTHTHTHTYTHTYIHTHTHTHTHIHTHTHTSNTPTPALCTHILNKCRRLAPY